MVDDPERSHDTDPLADTQAPEASDEASASTASTKRRAVNVGDSLDNRYELVDDVGEGGMATVYRARDKELRREVAVKVLFPHLARRDEVVRRFHREARAAAGLEHPNILRVYDVGGAESEDPPYIVMELIRGRSLLGEIEQRGPMLAEVVTCLGAVLADALVVAHKAGIIHRDIKPANVMLDGAGRVLLADFGVARLETEDSLVTKTGALLGTPAYMSPEQAAGDTATAQSDLYSLGATLYQLATAHLPYAGSPAKVLAQIAQGQFVSAVKKRTEVGPDLSRLIDRLMAVETSGRPKNASEVAAELRAMITASGFGEPKDELAAYFADSDGYLEAKTPVVVASLVKAGRAAIADGKLPRAIAIADRASALAPNDPAVAELVSTVTEGGRSSQRRRIAAIGGIGVLVAGGVTVGALKLFGGGHAHAVLDAPQVAATEIDATPTVATPFDAVPAVVTPDAVVEPALDAAVPRSRDAGMAGRLADARAADAPPPISIDAMVAVATPVDAAVAASGFIVIKTDGWCNVTIDGVARGRAGTKALEVTAGPHTVVCEREGMAAGWTKQVTVPAGATVEARGSLLRSVQVTFAVDAVVDGKAYTAGQTATFPPGRPSVEIGGKREYVDITRPCQIRGTPGIGCY